MSQVPLDPRAQPLDPRAQPLDPRAQPLDPRARPNDPRMRPPIAPPIDHQPSSSVAEPGGFPQPTGAIPAASSSGSFSLSGLSALAASLGLPPDAPPPAASTAPAPIEPLMPAAGTLAAFDPSAPPMVILAAPSQPQPQIDFSSLSALAGALGVAPEQPSVNPPPPWQQQQQPLQQQQQQQQQQLGPCQFAVIPQPGFSISLVTVEADGSVNSGPLPPGPMPASLHVIRGDKMITASELGGDFLDRLAKDAMQQQQQQPGEIPRPAEELLSQESWALLQKIRASLISRIVVPPEPPGPAGPMRREAPTGAFISHLYIGRHGGPHMGGIGIIP